MLSQLVIILHNDIYFSRVFNNRAPSPVAHPDIHRLAKLANCQHVWKPQQDSDPQSLCLNHCVHPGRTHSRTNTATQPIITTHSI